MNAEKTQNEAKTKNKQNKITQTDEHAVQQNFSYLIE